MKSVLDLQPFIRVISRKRPRRSVRLDWPLLAIALLGAANTTVTAYRDVTINDVPHVRQKPDFCGEACAEMVLRKLGKSGDQDSVFDRSGLDPALGRGCYTPELARALKQIGFKVGDVWYSIAPTNAVKGMVSQWAALHDDLCRGCPSIVCMHASDSADTTEHFRLVLGYDSAKDEVIYHEPAEAKGAYLRMSRDSFLRRWPLKDGISRWTVIRLRCEPGHVTDAPTVRGFTAADYAQHVMQIRKKLGGKAFTILVEPPFIVVSDMSNAGTRRYSEGTVKWAVDMLKKDYFADNPAEIHEVWLFMDKESYERNTWAIFQENPTTPFGYYSDEHKALIMNIGTGGGTLVHEIVHPFIRANFPSCPAWLNEGLGSLYEQCEEKDGHIHGRTNWQLSGLQTAIRRGELLSFEKLTGTTSAEFYGEGSGSHYAQARYLCYYLQEKGLLVKFYKEFRAGRDADPAGFKTLKKVLGEDDMAAFQKKWEQFVLKLAFP